MEQIAQLLRLVFKLISPSDLLWSGDLIDQRNQNQFENYCKTGDFPVDCVWVLPTLTKPHPDVVSLFKLSRSELESLASRAPTSQNVNLNEEMENIYNLEEYAVEHFNAAVEEAGSFFSFKPKERQCVWAKSQQPLRQPLLRATPSTLSDEATYCFLTILKYCGDYPSKKPKQGNELTDIIFQAKVSISSRVGL